MSLILQGLLIVLASVSAFMLVGFLAQKASVHFSVSEAEEMLLRAREQAQPSYIKRVLRTWARRFAPAVPERTRSNLTRQITMAGGLDGMTAAELVIYAVLSTIGGAVAGVYVVYATGWTAWLVLGTTVAGAAVPFMWLRDQVKKRHLDIMRDLPYQLDLLTLCVEAGLDFGAGVARIVEKGPDGPLKQEFVILLSEIRVGKTRVESLQAMSERVGLEALSTFLSSLIQADRMGTGLGRTLRLQAEQTRQERFQRAEKLAGEAPVKMLLPLVVFIFPTIWIILSAPIIFDWVFGGGGF